MLNAKVNVNYHLKPILLPKCDGFGVTKDINEKKNWAVLDFMYWELVKEDATYQKLIYKFTNCFFLTQHYSIACAASVMSAENKMYSLFD